MPCVPVSMNSGIAETGVDNIHSFCDAASIKTLGSPSRSPSRAMRLGKTKTSESRIALITSGWSHAPRHVIRSWMFNTLARATSASPSPPPPMCSQCQSNDLGSRAKASIRLSNPFFSTNRPTDRNRTRFASVLRVSGGAGNLAKSKP